MVVAAAIVPLTSSSEVPWWVTIVVGQRVMRTLRRAAVMKLAVAPVTTSYVEMTLQNDVDDGGDAGAAAGLAEDLAMLNGCTLYENASLTFVSANKEPI